jgi:FixJ family two-component response regulator
MTGHPSADLTRQALALGAVAVIAKPMREADLLRFVRGSGG